MTNRPRPPHHASWILPLAPFRDSQGLACAFFCLSYPFLGKLKWVLTRNRPGTSHLSHQPASLCFFMSLLPALTWNTVGDEISVVGQWHSSKHLVPFWPLDQKAVTTHHSFPRAAFMWLLVGTAASPGF